MNNTRYERRSTEAPMDFEWTDKDRDVIGADSPFRSAKRSHADMATPMPSFPQHNPPTPIFGANRDVPFMFNHPLPNAPPTNPWTPPPSRLTLQRHETEMNDVTMQDVSPPKSAGSDSTPGTRAVATGALRRVFRARNQHNAASRTSFNAKRRGDRDEEDDAGSDDEAISEDDQPASLAAPQRKRRGLQKSYSEPATTNHNHHYTLHMPAQQMSHSDVPYLLLGYLQFFFNLSLVSGFLYLSYQFLRAVQKDVEQKMIEYSIGSLHNIRTCARQYEENFCADKPSPIIMQQCQEWKECMEHDASLVSRTKLFAELVGEVINGLMEPITWRSLIFTLASLSMGIAFVNVLLTFYRGRHSPVPQQSARPYHAPSFPMYNSMPPYWGPQPPAPLPFNPSEVKQRWSTSGEDVAEEPSRRRKIHEGDAIKIT